VLQVVYVRPKNIPAFCADLLEARLVERNIWRPEQGQQTNREAKNTNKNLILKRK
jgi:hypothetical protein